MIPFTPFKTRIPEDRVGPGFAKSYPERYRVAGFLPAQCIQGSLAPLVDFAVRTAGEPQQSSTDLPLEAFVWHYCEPTDRSCERASWRVAPGASQYNACFGVPFNGVWDSEITKYEPMVFTLAIDRGGDTTLAYYFLEGVGECRNMAYDLFINDPDMTQPIKTGTIQRVENGKYLVFDIRNLPDVVNRVTLKLSIVPDDSGACNGGPNVVLGGAFLGGPICGTPAIDIRKQAEGPDSREFDPGAPVSFEIAVRNAGPVPLTNVEVTDILVPACNAFFATLGVGEQKVYTCDAPNASSGYVNIACVTGKGNGIDVRDCDPSKVTVREKAALGDFVWIDQNGNGIQDGGETLGAVGAVATLYQCVGGLPTAPAPGQAPQGIGPTGAYFFSGLVPGSYAVQFSVPAGFSRSPADQGVDDARDSDAHPTTGFSPCVTLAPGDVNRTIDAGVVPSPPVCVPTTFRFSGDSPTGGSSGNIRTFAVGGVSVRVSAFARSKPAGGWQKAYLGLYGQGLGVTDSIEGDGGNGLHRVDNVGNDNFVLFEFSAPVVVTRAFLDSVVNDSDITVWVGTFADPYNNHLVLSDAVLGAFALRDSSLASDASSRWAPFNGASMPGNALVIAADVDDKSPEDRFKISKLDACVPGGPAPAALGDFVWHDLDADGIADANEPGIDGVIVRLLDTANNVLAIATTGDDPNTGGIQKGYYQFTGLIPGVPYKVAFTAPAGFSSSPRQQGGNPATDSDGPVSDPIVLAAGQFNQTIDSGFTKAVYCAPKTFSFYGSSALDGPDGNVRTFSTGGLTVSATAFSRSKSSGTWLRGYLGLYGEGLGVTDSSEGDGGNGRHRVDNIDRDNYILFQFTEDVVVSKALLQSVVSDSDITIWVGDLTTANPMLSDSLLNGFSLTEDDLTSSSSDRWASFNGRNLVGNAFVIAAQPGDTSPEDQFKVGKLDVCKPTY